MRVNFPGQPPQHYSANFLSQFTARVALLFGQVVSSEQEAPCIILSSPNGQLWRVSVSDAGALVVAGAGAASLSATHGSPPA
jgi:hypothetical protein